MKKLMALLIVVLVSACAGSDGALFGGDDRSGDSSGGFGGTFMKDKIANFRSEQEQVKKVVEGRRAALQSMRGETNSAVTDYRTAVAQINSKLQLGTTPGNPELMDEWKSARAKLERVSNIAFDIKRLTADVESDQSMVEYMVGSIQAAYKIRGATEDDHKQLRAIEEEARQTGSGIAAFARQVGQEADRQQAYVDGEKYNLNDVALNIKNGKLYGSGGSQDFFADGGSMFSSDESYSSFIQETQSEYGPRPDRPDRRPLARPAGRFPVAPAPAPSAPVERMQLLTPAPAASSSARPLVSIKFDRADVDFSEPLYQALSRALERNPAATFEVSGVMPYGTPTADKTLAPRVKKVMNSLVDMGLPASRVAITMQMDNVSVDEVRVYEK
jgi:hypothetical protein